MSEIVTLLLLSLSLVGGQQGGHCVAETRTIRTGLVAMKIKQQENFVIPQSLIEPTCPTCYYKKNFCDMTCSPDKTVHFRQGQQLRGGAGL